MKFINCVGSCDGITTLDWYRVSVLAAFILLAPLQAAAETSKEPSYTPQFKDCIERSAGVTSDMLNCIATETEIQDARLNAAYRVLMNQLPAYRQNQLQEVQRLWIEYRNLNCNFYADPDGGTAALLVSADCFLKATASRARDLELLHE